MMRTFTLVLAIAATASAFAPQSASRGASDVAMHAERRDVLAGIALAPLAFAAPALAKDAPKATSYAGVYSDPNHPRGYRVIRETPKGAVIVLQDEPKGEIFTLKANTSYNKKKDETTLKIDFSAKGGPKDIKGVFSKDKITFPDGNAWPKAKGIDGVYSDPQHPKGYRVVKVKRDGTVCVELQDDAKSPVLELTGKMKNSKGYLFIDFSPKGGPKDLPATFKNNKIVFPDGNAWQKL